MTREDIIRMARDAGFRTGYTDLASGDEQMRFVDPIGSTCLVELERFAELVAAAEREAMKPAIIEACKANTREMEGYSYFGSNPGVQYDDYEDVANDSAAIRVRSSQ